MAAHLVVEVDGGQHDAQQNYDKHRDDWLRTSGFRVLRFWNNEITQNLSGAFDRITQALHDVPMDKRPGPKSPRPAFRARTHVGSLSGKAPGREANPRAPRNPHNDDREIRLFGLNACLAAFAHRPDDLRKVYLSEERIPALQPVLAWCVQQRLGYRVVESADLDKLTQTQHHEGVCFDMLRRPPLQLAVLLNALPNPPQPAALIVFDGVGNPHNFGAVLRSAAHFGVNGLILPSNSRLALSGAACRVAEGGAEAVPVAQAVNDDDMIAVLRREGFCIAATVAHSGNALYQTQLPARLALLFGAEGSGLSERKIQAADLRLTIPGTGAVESLNIAASAAVVLGEYYRQQGALK